MTTTCPCDMPDSGEPIYYCPRLDIRMTPHWCHLYHTRDNYRLAWDEGRGPGQVGLSQQAKSKPKHPPKGLRVKKRELGDYVEQALSSVGITEERVSKWLGRPCGCRERKERLNQLSRWARRVLTGKSEDAEEYLERIIDE